MRPELAAGTISAPQPTRPLADRVALVTGSTSGIGLGIARALAAGGARLVLNGLGDATEIEATRAALAAETGAEVVYAGADLARPDEITDMVADVARSFGGIDVLVSNAGVLHTGPTLEMPLERWHQTLAINLTAGFVAARAVLPGMRRKGYGRIIGIASALGLVGAAGYAAYAASKHGTVGLVRSLALELAAEPVTVNAICPGFVLTPLVERELAGVAATRGITPAAAAAEALAAAQPSGRFVTPEEIGGLAVFLCGEVARSLTGAAIPIDGGWTAR